MPRKPRKDSEPTPDRGLYEIWWNYLIRTEAFGWFRQYAIQPKKYKTHFWEKHLAPFEDFITGYCERGWLIGAVTPGTFGVCEDFETIWKSRGNNELHLSAIDGTLGENIIERLIYDTAISTVERIELIENRIRRRLLFKEKRRVAIKEAKRTQGLLKNRLVLCLDPFSATAEDLSNTVEQKINSFRKTVTLASPVEPFEHLPIGGDGCRYRYPTPCRKVDRKVFKRRLTFYVLMQLCQLCRRPYGGSVDDFDNPKPSYKLLLTGQFEIPGERSIRCQEISDSQRMENRLYALERFLPFGIQPLHQNDIGKLILKNWKNRDENKPPKTGLRAEYEKEKKALEEDIGAAREMLESVSNGWFPLPPHDWKK